MPFSPNSSPACALHADRFYSKNYPRNINHDDSVKSRHSGENRSPECLQPFEHTVFSDKSENDRT